jgi:AcrR family transcriptional regulator
MNVNEKLRFAAASQQPGPHSVPFKKGKRSPAKTKTAPKSEDHRVRVARVRRAKMRAHLLRSVFEVCSGEKDREPAVIDDVVRHAKVSRGTFYTYFDSMEIAIAELGLELADEMTAGLLVVYDVLEDPVMRTATGFQMFLLRSAMDRPWAAFIARIGLLSDNHLFTSKIKSDIQLGVESGDYVVASIDFATDLLMGAKIEAIRRILAGEGTAFHIQTMASMVLRSFGVSPSKAEKSVQKAYSRIQLLAPSKIPWWRPID